MGITLKQLNQLLLIPHEGKNLEFKEAKNRYDFEKLVKYCVALANEGGGEFILGITDKVPRKIVGTKAFRNLGSTTSKLIDLLHIRIDVEEINRPNGRIIIFQIPSRSVGMPISYKGAYWMRKGEELAPMTPDMLKRIFDESGPDFSAEICLGANINDLDPRGIQRFKELWRKKSHNEALDTLSNDQLLSDAELLIDGGVTNAALILLGTRQALGRYFAQSEIIFEYRANETSIPSQQRIEYRQGFFLIQNDLWNAINLRNEIQSYRDGLFVWDIPTFNEGVVREAVLNAICHRDYRLAGSVFIRQFPRKLEIESPGGFPPGITPENILWKQFPRNRRIAETLGKCGLVERAGQGADLMFEECIKESKPKPDFSGTDDYQVLLTLKCEVQDPRFLNFLEQISAEKQVSFSTLDLLVLDSVHKEQTIPNALKNRLASLRERGIIEVLGHGRGTRYILTRRFYNFLGKGGVYTRKRGLDRDTNRALLLKHIQENKGVGCQLKELMQVLPHNSRNQIQNLLRDLKSEGKIQHIGQTKAARWYPSSITDKIAFNNKKT